MQWRVISETALGFRCWDDEFVVYNELSGDTHLLGPMAAQILLTLQQASSDVMTLAATLSGMFPAEKDGQLALQIEQVLADLDRLELITRS